MPDGKRRYYSNPGSLSRTRQDHLRETAEDYVELIAHLIETHGEARVAEMAVELGVSQVTVSKTVQRLQRDGYVVSRPYRSIFLTDEGKQLAEEATERHRIVVRFLVKLGVPVDVARIDAEGIEHHVSNETLHAMCRYIVQLESQLA